MAGPSGGAGQGLSTPVHFGTAGLPTSQAHELVNGTKQATPHSMSMLSSYRIFKSF